MQDLVLKYNGLLVDFVTKPQIIAKTSTSLQLSVSEMLTHVKFPTFAMADLRYGRLIHADRGKEYCGDISVCVFVCTSMIISLEV